MRQQKEQTALSQEIKASAIETAIDELNLRFNTYQKMTVIMEHRYSIQLEFSEVLNDLEKLRSKLDELISSQRYC